MDVAESCARDIASRISSEALFYTTNLLTKDPREVYDRILNECWKAKLNAREVYNIGMGTLCPDDQSYKDYKSICDANDAIVDKARREFDRARHDIYYKANEAADKARALVYETAKNVFAPIYCPVDDIYRPLYDKFYILRDLYPHTEEFDDVQDALIPAPKALAAAKEKAYNAAFDAATALYNSTKN